MTIGVSQALRANVVALDRAVDGFANLVQLGRHWASARGDRTAFAFLEDGEVESDALTFAALDRKARAIAACLQDGGLAEKPVLLLFPSGLEFIAGFFGCLYARAIAIPGYPVLGPGDAVRIRSIVAGCGAEVALTNASVIAGLHTSHEAAEIFSSLELIDIDVIDEGRAGEWVEPVVGPDDLAFVQYTSGSTDSPHGVRIKHANLLYNQWQMAQVFDLDHDAVIVSWLPLFHDMGLVGAMLQAFYRGIACYLMPPAAFLEKPIRWLRAISRFDQVISLAPNFAYDHCVRHIHDDDKATLDLSGWVGAVNGSEPVRADTIERFIDAFRPYGFRRETFYPSYGLAEATLFVTGDPARLAPTIKWLDPDALGRGHVVLVEARSGVALVGCGRAWGNGSVRIVDPDTGAPSAAEQIGEIWVKGDNVADGYWAATSEAAYSFHARIAGTSEGPYLRTGDLGFVADGKLFVTGRLKDLIIIRGENHYPHEIEHTVESSHAGLRAAGGAAFAVDAAGAERLVVVHELERSALRGTDPEEVIAAIRRIVAHRHGLEVYAVVLIKSAQLPRSSSGKVRRRACREAFLTGKLAPVASWTAGIDDSESIPAGPVLHAADQTQHDMRLATLTAYLQTQVAALLATEPARIEPDVPLVLIGMTSLRAAELSLRVARDYGVEVALGQWLSGLCLKDAAAGLVERVAAADAKGMARTREGTTLSRSESSATEPFPLTDIQEAYWLGRADSFLLGGIATHAYFEIDIVDMDLARLNVALDRLITRHEMLRMVLGRDGRQRVLETLPPYSIPLEDMRNAPHQEREARLAHLREELAQKVLDPYCWPLFDIRATGVDERRTRLHVSVDMLIADGWSLGRIFEEWFALYRTPQGPLPALSMSFRDYVGWLREVEGSWRFARARDYWLSRLDQLSPPPQLPFACSPHRLTVPRGGRRRATLGRDAWAALKVRGRACGLTPSAVVAAAYAEVLAFWSRESAFTINVTLLNRPSLHPEIDYVIGDFTALNLLAVDVRERDSFQAHAVRLQQQLLQDVAHREFSGVRVLRELASRGTTRAPFVVFTSLLDLAASQPRYFPTGGEWVYGLTQTSQSCLDLLVWEENGELILAWDAVEALFPPGVLDDMFQTYHHRLQVLARSDGDWTRTGPVDLRPAAQRERHAAVNATAETPSRACLHGLFVEHAKRAPQACAVASETTRLSYAQLYHAARALGGKVERLGAAPNDVVAVALPKGPEQMVAALGVLFSGAAYLPIDPSWPMERRTQVLREAAVRIVLVDAALDGALEWPEGVQRVPVTLADTQVDPQSVPPGEFAPRQQPEDLAYVMFTSGTTGSPKGVMVPHRGAVNTILDINRRFSVSRADKVLGLSSLSFDLSVYDVFGLLAAGGTIVIPDERTLRDPARWTRLIEAEGVTLWNSVPAFMQMWVDHLERDGTAAPQTLRLVLMSGDWIPVTLPARIRDRAGAVEIASLAGPTETSIWSVAYPIAAVDPAWASIPYGKPLTNQTVYVLKPDFTPCPDWVAGELYIGGLGLAHGYWNDPERTNAQFVTHPYTGERLFKSGDIGRFLPAGDIEFLGRKDGQVKLSGYRIELGEIEANLRAHPAVHEAIALMREDRPGERRLAAYVVPKAPRGKADSEAEAGLVDALRALLVQKLPSYMVPQAIIVLSALPLSPNGKVDRHALPMPRRRTGKTQASPANEIERKLLSIWQAVLDNDQLGIDDNFNDVGGNSRLIVQVHHHVCETFAVDVEVIDLFKHSTIRRFAQYLTTQLDPGARVSTVTPLSNTGARAREHEAALARARLRRNRRERDAPAAGPLLTDPEARARFKADQPGSRPDVDALPVIALDGSAGCGLDRVPRRLSTRHFADTSIPLALLDTLLSCLRQEPKADAPTYRYPSGGGLYAVQVYLWVRPGRVRGLSGGVYYYHPGRHRLHLLGDEQGSLSDIQVVSNRVFSEGAAFSLFLIAKLDAVTQMYGSLARDFCLIEAGAMLQLVMETAARIDLGVCPIGMVDVEPIARTFKLSEHQVLLHSILAGPVS